MSSVTVCALLTLLLQSRGLWTLPAGFMELGESAAEGAVRETWEEACARVRAVAPFAHFDVPAIGQSYVLFRAELAEEGFAAGAESLDVRMVALEEMDEYQLAFSSIRVALREYVADAGAGRFRVHSGVIAKKALDPSDPNGFDFLDHVAL